MNKLWYGVWRVFDEKLFSFIWDPLKLSLEYSFKVQEHIGEVSCRDMGRHLARGGEVVCHKFSLLGKQSYYYISPENNIFCPEIDFFLLRWGGRGDAAAPGSLLQMPMIYDLCWILYLVLLWMVIKRLFCVSDTDRYLNLFFNVLWNRNEAKPP